MTNYQIDNWNPWTEKSDDVDFEKKGSGVGHGEYKLGKEFDIVPLGQNFSYDLEFGHEKWEVKKLDNGNSFRIGVKGASQYSNLKTYLINVIHKLQTIENEEELISDYYNKKVSKILEEFNSKFGLSRTTIYEGLRKDELSEENLSKLSDLLEELREMMFFNLKSIKLYSSYNGKKIQDLPPIAINKIKIEDISDDQKIEIFGGEDLYDKNLITSEISKDLEILTTKTLREILNEIVRESFSDTTCVIVDKHKGYRPVSIKKIYCSRITSGSPRGKIDDIS